MKHALMVSPDGTSKIVTADGKELGRGDVTQRVLHILPQLYVPAHALSVLQPALISAEISSSLDVDLAPAGGVVIRQPYPNQRYFVGGSADIRNGWVVPIPEGVTTFDLQIYWFFYRIWSLTDIDNWHVRHDIHVTLQPGDGNTFSMDVSNWPQSFRARKNGGSKITARLGLPDEVLDITDGRDIVRHGPLSFPAHERDFHGGYYIEENLILPGIKMDQAHSIDAFQEEQLHEVIQVAKFEQGNEQHLKNSSIECPAKLLIEAVHLSRAIPFDQDTEFAASIAGVRGGYERHPAMKLLADWWTEHRPLKTEHKVGFVMPWVRVRDDNEYWCGYYETPNESIELFEDDVGAQAHIGNAILLVFFASHEHFTADADGIHIMLANGTPFSTIGMDPEDLLSGEFDEAWYSLKALERFPERFPAAWKHVTQLARSRDA